MVGHGTGIKLSAEVIPVHVILSIYLSIIHILFYAFVQLAGVGFHVLDQ